MIILTLVVAVEKVWGADNSFPGLVGIACFGLAIVGIWFSQMAPSMVPSMTMLNMGG